MLKLWYALMTSMLLIALGCASKGRQVDQQSAGTPQITYTEVTAAPRTFNGQPVTFGGKVLSARRLKEGTRIEILNYPSRLHPNQRWTLASLTVVSLPCRENFLTRRRFRQAHFLP
ncbi:MAG: Slp family lipoprotein [Nitrospira sp.]|nr:Slp family lipoprotein [Nitrospira sp.]